MLEKNMHDLSLYEKKIINDEEFPVQINTNRISKPGVFFAPHWHEHFELHYILEGQCIIYSNQKPLQVDEGSLVIINSNELHEGISLVSDYSGLVIIFKMSTFSKEVANYHVVFQSLISGDTKIKNLMKVINEEENGKMLGYKLALKGQIYELITYLLRNYVVENLSDKENLKRIQNLERLNLVLQYIRDNYAETITISELAQLIHLSDYRFCHLFKESVGQSPLNYINEVRLKNAHQLLEKKDMTISEVALAVGFQDYNNFGRLFRRYYGYPPSQVWS
jgi:AraC-like DNA-binding protein